MSESLEGGQKESHRRIIEISLQKLFDDLKEHLGSLRLEDYHILSGRFSDEVDGYVGELIKQMAESRKARRQRKEER